MGNKEFYLSCLPTLAYSVAKNQNPNAIELEKNKGGIYMGEARMFNPEKLTSTIIALAKDGNCIERMSGRMHAWIDGNGRKRVTRQIVDAIQFEQSLASQIEWQ